MAEENDLISSTSSLSIRGGSWKYDVFLSFRGPDTRNSFTDHLRDALIREGIQVFMDDEELPRGNEISRGLLDAIRTSKISIVVFSVTYDVSKWCLNELVEILNCRDTIKNMVIPIFYGVDPAQVRRKMGSYGEALAVPESCGIYQDEIKAWRKALSEVASLSGEHLHHGCSESKFIKKILKDVLSIICPKELHVADHPVGLESRMEDLCSLSRLLPQKVCMIGVHGMGGIGKSVVAKSFYNRHAKDFDHSCFLENVREKSKELEGLVRLQTQLLSSVHIQTANEISSVDLGKIMIKTRCCSKKVLLVIDDADEPDHIKSFVGERNWFGPGSRIIITTRDERLLRQIEVDEIYEAKLLNKKDSEQLFLLHAFKESEYISPILMELSCKVIEYAGGLPLALEVLGSYLKGIKRNNIKEWKSTIEKLHEIPNGKVQDKLLISYDTLDDDVKEIFLDIACFFIGMDEDYVVNILDGCGFFTASGIGILKSRSLLTVDGTSNLRMHDLLRDMGREIVRRESPDDDQAGKRSRLWSPKVAPKVLKNCKGTDSVKGIRVVQPWSDKMQLPVDAFAYMSNLRLLQMENVSLAGSYEHLSRELRWIDWPSCDWKDVPSGLCLQHLVVLDMKYSEIHSLKFERSLESLKTIDLSHSKWLEKTPDLSGSLKLEAILLEGCIRLSVVHESIGLLKKLTHLNLKDCSKLRRLPPCVYNLQLLQHFDISGTAIFEQKSSFRDKFRSFVKENCAFVNSFCPLFNLESWTARTSDEHFLKIKDEP